MPLTQEMVKREHSPFATWAKGKRLPGKMQIPTGTNLPDEFLDKRTQAAWEAWKEVRAQSQRAVGVEELRCWQRV